MEIRQAKYEELEMVCQLYKSMVGSEFCVWNEFYPGMDEAKRDFEAGGLLVLVSGGRIIGCMSLSAERELDGFEVWRTRDGSEQELARVAVEREFQRRGIATYMVTCMIGHLRQIGCSAVRLSVADKNLPAMKMYANLGFEVVGEADMYGGHYYLMEAILGLGYSSASAEGQIQSEVENSNHEENSSDVSHIGEGQGLSVIAEAATDAHQGNYNENTGKDRNSAMWDDFLGGSEGGEGRGAGKKILKACAWLLVLVTLGFCAKLFFLGTEVPANMVKCNVNIIGGEVHIDGEILQEGRATARVSVQKKDGGDMEIKIYSAPKTFFNNIAFKKKVDATGGVGKVYTGEAIWWQDGIKIDSGVSKLFSSKNKDLNGIKLPNLKAFGEFIDNLGALAVEVPQNRPDTYKIHIGLMVPEVMETTFFEEFKAYSCILMATVDEVSTVIWEYSSEDGYGRFEVTAKDLEAAAGVSLEECRSSVLGLQKLMESPAVSAVAGSELMGDGGYISISVKGEAGAAVQGISTVLRLGETEKVYEKFFRETPPWEAGSSFDIVSVNPQPAGENGQDAQSLNAALTAYTINLHAEMVDAAKDLTSFEKCDGGWRIEITAK